MELCEELGYRFDQEVLRQEFEQATGRPLTSGTMNWYEAAAPYIIMAYQAGRSGKALSAAFKFLEAI